MHPRMRGKTAAQFRPYSAEMMVKACRKLASDMRREAALGWPPIVLWDGSSISREEAAASMDRRGDEWAKKATR